LPVIADRSLASAIALTTSLKRAQRTSWYSSANLLAVQNGRRMQVLQCLRTALHRSFEHRPHCFVSTRLATTIEVTQAGKQTLCVPICNKHGSATGKIQNRISRFRPDSVDAE
jgi:hypothetical protein